MNRNALCDSRLSVQINDPEGPESSCGSFSNYRGRSPSASGGAAASANLNSKWRAGRRESANSDAVAHKATVQGGGETHQAAGPDLKRRQMRWIVIAAILGMILLSTASMIGWAVSYRAGVASVESTGLRLQESYPKIVMFEVITRMEPARVHLQQGLELLHQLGLDPTTWEAYEAIRTHGVSFLLNYFDDTQCCYGFFTRMGYEPGVNEDNFGDDRALFDAVIASKDVDPVSGEPVTALFDLRPEDTNGSRVNNAYWVPFNMTTRRLPEKLEVTDHQSLGFVHFPRDDGVEPNNPDSGWWNIINSRDMQEGDFCFSPIFVWNLNEPITLKIHGIVPVFAQAGAARERVGAYVVGFKLHFLSKALQNLDHKEGPIFLVEKSTGYIIASNSDAPLMSEDLTAIKASEVSNAAIKGISEYLAPDGSWSDVGPGHKDLINVDGVRSYIFVEEFNHYCLDWVIVVAIERNQVLEQFNEYTTGSVISSFAIPFCVIVFSCLILLGGFLLNRFLKNSKKGSKRGPPKQGDKVTLVTTDIQGSTTLWDTYPDKVARDIALHHQCLRHSLKDFQGYEIATEGDSFKCAFHTSEDAVCWAIQVQFNLLCAPWSEELEDGGQGVLGDDITWADTGLVMLPEHCEELIWGLTKDVSVFRAERRKSNGARSFRPSMDSVQSTDDKDTKPSEMFSPSDAASTPYSACQSATMPLYVVHHTDGSRLPVFRGLRVRIGMHTGIATDVKVHESTKRMMYGGHVAQVAKAVSDMPCGGQIIMTSETLADIESMHDLMLKVSDQCSSWCSSMSCAADSETGQRYSEPAAMSVMHLGSHVILKPPAKSSQGVPSEPHQNTRASCPKLECIVSGEYTLSTPTSSNEIIVETERVVRSIEDKSIDEEGAGGDEGAGDGGGPVSAALRDRMAQAHELVMVVPWPLRSRALFFPPLPAEKEVAPAWHAAPPAKGVTIVFTFIENWSNLKQWDDESAKECEGWVPVVPKALEELNLVVRTILTANHGYEVEGEDGNYVCAFDVPENAMQFAVQLQDALMRVEWDEALLKTPWAAEQRRPDGVLIFRGLRMSVGMCTGDARRVQPSVRTGRQEYYGPIMNHAARLAVAAHGSQVLIHEDTVAAWRSSEETREPGEECGKLPMYLVSLGKHKLKGVSRPIEISELSCPLTATRSFPRIKAVKSLQALDLGGRRASDYGRNFRGSEESSRRASIQEKIEASSRSISGAAAMVGSSQSLQALVSLGRRSSVSFAQNRSIPGSPPRPPSYLALNAMGRRRTIGTPKTDSADDSKNSESSPPYSPPGPSMLGVNDWREST